MSISSYTFTSQSLFGQKKTFFTPLTPDFNLPHITLFNFIFAKSTVQYYKIFYISYMTFTKKCVLTKDWHPTPIGKKLRKILDYNVVLKKWLSKNLSMTWEIEMNRVAVAVLCCSYCENVSDYKMLPKGNLVLISLIRKKLSFFLDQNPLFSLFLTLLLTFLEKRCCNLLGGKLVKTFSFSRIFFTWSEFTLLVISVAGERYSTDRGKGFRRSHDRNLTPNFITNFTWILFFKKYISVVF